MLIPANLFADLPTRLQDELFTTLLESAKVRIERIVSHGHASPGGFWYDQGQHEWVMVLKGAARLRFEGAEQLLELKPGDFIDIPAHKRHQVEWTTPDEPTIWLAIHHGDDPTIRSLIAPLLLAAPLLAAGPNVHRDVAYAEPKSERQTLDVYAPPGGKAHPVVFWIHGGGWQRGDKSEVQAKPRAFVDKGFVFVSTNYRFVPHVTIKEMAGDVAKAIRWTHDHAEEFGGDPDTIFVMGHSAGAQLAALVCTDDRYLKAEGLSPSILKGCVPVDGDTYDVPMQIATVEAPRAGIYRQKFGEEMSQKDLSPVTHVAKGKHIPPFVILHVADHPETKGQSQRLAKALREAGVPAKAFPAEGKNHGTINSDIGVTDDGATKVVFEFLEEALRRTKKAP